MSKWYVKKLSQLTGVSVQALHHYDRIDLLKPSLRLPNGYRMYSEADLLKLQQIVALKFFGFELSQIKAILQAPGSALEHFKIQEKLLHQKANALLQAQNIMQTVINNAQQSESIPWETIMQLIEVYQMTDEVKNTWINEIFTTQELKEYATLAAEKKTDLLAFDKAWDHFTAEIDQNLDVDPYSDTGVNLGRRCMELINKLYGKKHAHLRTKIMEQGFGEGKGLSEAGLTPESVSWLEKAIDAYLHQRIGAILEQAGKKPDKVVQALWDEMLDDLYGDQDERKKLLVKNLLKDHDLSQAAKQFLKSSN